jgi:hypothetical protein
MPGSIVLRVTGNAKHGPGPRVEGTMTVAEWCVFGAVMLYLLTIAPFKAIGFRHFDNSKPRDPA